VTFATGPIDEEEEEEKESGCTAPFIPNFYTRRSVDKLMLQRLNFHANILRFPQRGMLGGPQRRL